MGVVIADKWVVERVKKLLPTRAELEKAMRDSHGFDDDVKVFRQALVDIIKTHESDMGMFCPYGVDDCGGHYIGLGFTLNSLLNKRDAQVRVWNLREKPEDEDYPDNEPEQINEGRLVLILHEDDSDDSVDYWFCKDCAYLIVVLDGYSLYNVVQEML